MPKYGSGVLYGAGAEYGRISDTLAAAQALHHRQTGLKVSVVDEQLNMWEHWAGSHSHPEGLGQFYADANGGFHTIDIQYYAYRGWHSMETLGNGTIVRVRNGNPADVNDRQIWINTIADPTVPAQWNVWSVLYSGTHYGAATIVVTGVGTYDVYHFKGDGNVYINNVAVVDMISREGEEPLIWIPVEGRPGAGWVVTIEQAAATKYDGRRLGNNWYFDDLPGASTEFFDRMNFMWYRGGLAAIETSPDQIARLGSFPIHFNSRDGDHGNSMFYCEQTDIGGTNELSPPYIVRGVGGGAGSNSIIGLHIKQLSDGYYYYSAQETHQEQDRDTASSLGMGIPVWARSKNLKHWSDPVIGPPLENISSASPLIEVAGYIYLADNEEVWRRPIGTLSYEISNYVPSVEFDLPRDNQAGTGSLVVANPTGVNDFLNQFTDKEIVVEVGIKTEAGIYEYTQFDRFWLKRPTHQVEGKVNRLSLEFGNLWDRLDTSMRDVTNHIGQTDWHDWEPGARNKAFNYFFLSDSSPDETADYRLTTRGICLFTAWKGHNVDVTVHFSGLTGHAILITKYIDVDNYEFFEYNSSTGHVDFKNKIDGVETILDAWSTVADSTPKIRVIRRWLYYRIFVNDVEYGDPAVQWYAELEIHQPGYVGFSASSGDYTISSFHLVDWESALVTEDLIRNALAAGDLHDVIVSGADSRIFAIMWGPQTDVATTADALRTTLEIDRLQLVWRNGSLEIGKFNDETSVKTIENEIIKSEAIQEANRRINLAVVDGNEHFWMEVDVEDSKTRGRMVTSYIDLPELVDKDAVIARGQEEIKRSAAGASPGGTTPLFFDLWRMDAITWVDSEGNSKLVRIEGFSVEIDQGRHPHQRQTFDTAEYPTDTSDELQRPPPTVVGLP